MMRVVSRHWLRLRGKPTLVAVLDVTGQREAVRVGDVLVDEGGQEFTLAGVGLVRHATIEAANKHHNEATVTLVPAGAGTEPGNTLNKKPASEPTYVGDSADDNGRAAPEDPKSPPE